ncbi:hypothetical protein GGE16_001514 [Rhizobium leguminosarum]|uniref:Uncharacterized protein n=1 Tax=Rhizobium leguminosarum TaxID=384 RepID=A0AAE2SW63_RHILE|nr:hypothetical protein [Rhizobium leguminosarum]MBB4433465.1 hypothetical protein [Rhizobium esperanzae]MBB4294406.1 hypothetical protein [Rhizobium leguminosarum]MBB4305802.1 hypothetical protein [Rhizobium leguminosarum]MBB4418621.1 hypothetical protein [Rhizobium leguminosarum]
MFEFLDFSSYGKADVIPASIALAIGLLWATFVPYRSSEQYGLHPIQSVLRAFAVYRLQRCFDVFSKVSGPVHDSVVSCRLPYLTRKSGRNCKLMLHSGARDDGLRPFAEKDMAI